MKILIVSPTEKGIGGIAQHIQGLNDYLIKQGYKTETISSENTFIVPVTKLKNPSFMLSSFLKTISKKDFDIFHAFNMPSALSLKNATGKKILTLHGMYSMQIGIIHGSAISKLSDVYEKMALKWADVITVGSKQGYDYYSKLAKKAIYIPNAINIASLSTSVDRRFDKQVIFAGRLSKEKGIFTILELAKKLPADVHLLIAGGGPEKDFVEKISNSLSNIHFIGYQEKNSIISLIRGSDVLIQPSLSEGISSTILESMACKTPVIATNVGGNKELLIHNKTGILINEHSSDMLLREILDLLSNKQKAENLARSAYEEVQLYDWSNVGKLYVNLYNSLV